MRPYDKGTEWASMGLKAGVDPDAIDLGDDDDDDAGAGAGAGTT